MKDVAAALGLSPATISRALSRPDLVTPETRTAIAETVARLGYRPNLIARQLRRRSSGLVLFVFPKLSPFFLELFTGVEHRAAELGLSVLMAHSGSDAGRERMLVEQVLNRRADGILLVTGTQGSVLDGIATTALPVVAVLERVKGADLPTVRVDDRAAAAHATRRLVALGHRRIAHVAGPDSMRIAQDRRAGFVDAIGAAGLDPAHCPIIEGVFGIESGLAAAERLLTRYPRPTAIFAANDEIAVGVVQALKRADVGVGTEISVIGYDDQRLSRLYSPAITTVQLPKIELGRAAMTMLGDLIAGVPLAEREIVLPTALVERTTTGPCRE